MTLLNGHSLVKVSNYSEITREVTLPDWIKVITILHLCKVEWPYNLHIYTQKIFIRLIFNLRLDVKNELKYWFSISYSNMSYQRFWKSWTWSRICTYFLQSVFLEYIWANKKSQITCSIISNGSGLQHHPRFRMPGTIDRFWIYWLRISKNVLQ